MGSVALQCRTEEPAKRMSGPATPDRDAQEHVRTMSEARSLRRRPVVDYRQWLDTRGGGGPFGPLKDLPAQPPKEQLLDRKTFHTDLCPSCTGVRPSSWPGRSANLACGGVCNGRKPGPPESSLCPCVCVIMLP